MNSERSQKEYVEDDEEQGKKQKYVRIFLDDDNEVNDFDLQMRYTQKQIQMGDNLLLELGHNLMFVKSVVTQIFQGPYQILRSIKFSLLSSNQIFILSFINQHFYQIQFITDVGEDLFQLIEQCIILLFQTNQTRQIELFYSYQIDTHYNQLIFDTISTQFQESQQRFQEQQSQIDYQLEQNSISLIHISLIFEISDAKQIWKRQIVKSMSSFSNITNISCCWNIKLSEEDILNILNSCEQNSNLLIQAQNILFYTKSTSNIIQQSSKQLNYQEKRSNERQGSKELERDKIVIEKNKMMKESNFKHLFLDVSFFKPGLIEYCDVMSMKQFWQQISTKSTNYISIIMKFSTSSQIQSIIHPILYAIQGKNQTFQLDSRDLQISYDLTLRQLSLHFKEDTSLTKTFKPEDWSFIQPFINQYKNTTQKFQVILDNISFRHTNRHIYSQIIDFTKINHTISHFTIIAPMIIIQNDIRLKKIWKSHLTSLQILTYMAINNNKNTTSSLSSQNQQPSLYKSQNINDSNSLKKSISCTNQFSSSLLNNSNSGFIQQQKQQQSQQLLFQQQQRMIISDNKVISAVKRFRRNQFDALVKDFELNDQAYHLNRIIIEDQKIQKVNNQRNGVKLINNCFLSTDSRNKQLKELQDKVNEILRIEQTVILDISNNKKTKVFFSYEQNSKEKKISQKIDMREKTPEFWNEFISIPDFIIIHDLELHLQADTHDGQIDQMLKYLTSSRKLTNVKIRLFCNNLSGIIPKIMRFTNQILKELISIEFIVDGVFNGSLQKDCVREIVNILPFKEQPPKLKRGVIRFISLDNLINLKSMLEIFKYVGKEQTIEIKTKNLEIIKSTSDYMIKSLKVNCNPYSQHSHLFDSFSTPLFGHLTFQHVQLSLNELQFESFFGFIKIFTVISLDVTFNNFDLDPMKNNTYQGIKNILSHSYASSQMNNFQLKFYDQHSKSTAFLISYNLNSPLSETNTENQQIQQLSSKIQQTQQKNNDSALSPSKQQEIQIVTQKGLDESNLPDDGLKLSEIRTKYSHTFKIYFQGNQVYSDNFSYDRLLGICGEAKNMFEEGELRQLEIDITFDNKQRYERCKGILQGMKEQIFKNKQRIRSLRANVNIMDAFSRILEKDCIFDEQAKAISIKRKCFSNYALIYSSILNSSLKTQYRKEIFWDSISLILFGQLHANLKPHLSSLFSLVEHPNKIIHDDQSYQQLSLSKQQSDQYQEQQFQQSEMEQKSALEQEFIVKQDSEVQIQEQDLNQGQSEANEEDREIEIQSDKQNANINKIVEIDQKQEIHLLEDVSDFNSSQETQLKETQKIQLLATFNTLKNISNSITQNNNHSDNNNKADEQDLFDIEITD